MSRRRPSGWWRESKELYDDKFYKKFECDNKGRIIIRSIKDVNRLLKIQKTSETLPRLTLKTKDASYFFEKLYKLKSIEELEMKEVVVAKGLFKDCESLVELDRINSMSLMDASEMFENCFKLRSFPLTRVEKIRNLDRAFVNCLKLDTLRGVHFLSLRTLVDTFDGCESLRNIPYMQNFKKMRVSVDTFRDCESLDHATIEWITHFDKRFDYLFDISNEYADKSKIKEIDKILERNFKVSDELEDFYKSYKSFVTKTKEKADFIKRVKEQKDKIDRNIKRLSFSEDKWTKKSDEEKKSKEKRNEEAEKKRIERSLRKKVKDNYKKERELGKEEGKDKSVSKKEKQDEAEKRKVKKSLKRDVKENFKNSRDKDKEEKKEIKEKRIEEKKANAELRKSIAKKVGDEQEKIRNKREKEKDYFFKRKEKIDEFVSNNEKKIEEAKGKLKKIKENLRKIEDRELEEHVEKRREIAFKNEGYLGDDDNNYKNNYDEPRKKIISSDEDFSDEVDFKKLLETIKPVMEEVEDGKITDKSKKIAKDYIEDFDYLFKS